MMASHSEQLEKLLKKIRVVRDKMMYGAGGQNKKAVERVMEEQTKIGAEVDALISNMGDDAKGLSSAEIDIYQEALSHLNLANGKKLKCLQTQGQVSDLESLVWNLSSFVTKMSVMLVEAEGGKEGCSQKDKEQDKQCDKETLKFDQNVPGYIGQLSQNCIFGLTDSWDSINVLTRCAQQHVKNAALYHQFHHEVKESRAWMIHDLSDAIENFQRLQIDNPTGETINYFLSEFEAIHKALTHWRATLGRLSQSSSSLVPVSLRTRPLDTPLPVTSLANYTAPNMIIREGEMLTLLEGGEGEYWRVSNGRGQESTVPSVVVLVPPPDPYASQTLDELRMILLAFWTRVVRQYGARYVRLLLALLPPHYLKNQLGQFGRLEEWQKENMISCLSSTEQVLLRYWAQTRMFARLQERIGVAKVLLEDDADQEENTNQTDEASGDLDTLVEATPLLSDTTNIYDELVEGWEGWKTLMDLKRHPEMLLSLESWSQLQYLSTAQVAQFWTKKFSTEEFDDPEDDVAETSIDGESVRDVIKEETHRQESSNADTLLLHVTDPLRREKVLKKAVIQQQQQQQHEAKTMKLDQGSVLRRPEQMTSSETTEEITTTTTTTTTTAEGEEVDGGVEETETVMSESSEEKQTFTISSVLDPISNKQISLDEAIYKGIIIPQQGMYHNSKSGENVPIQVAMMQGFIRVTMTSKKISQPSSSLGLVTIKTMRPVERPFKVLRAKDTRSGRSVDAEEAVKSGVLDLNKGLFVDKVTGRRLALKGAVAKGLVEVEEGEEGPPEEVVKRYAVRAVVDRKERTTIPFAEAVRQRLIDGETGEFRDNVTGEKINIGEAVARGFVKARQVTEEEASSLDLDPRNSILIDRTEAIRKKVVRPLAVIGAFKNSVGK